MSKAAKFWIALAVSGGIASLTIAESALGDNYISPQEWATMALAFLGAVAVYLVPNKSP
jgi:hypothetical protein